MGYLFYPPLICILTVTYQNGEKGKYHLSPVMETWFGFSYLLKGSQTILGFHGYTWEPQPSMLWPLPSFQPPPPSLASVGLPQGQTRIQGQVVNLWGSTGWGVGVWYEDEKKSGAWCVCKQVTPADDRGLIPLGIFRRWSLACFRVTHLRDEGAEVCILQLLSLSANSYLGTSRIQDFPSALHCTGWTC